MDWTNRVQDWVQWRSLVNRVEFVPFPWKAENVLNRLMTPEEGLFSVELIGRS
jgi:hypothetical protein